MTVRIKATKSSTFREDTSCRRCDTNGNEPQEHLEICQGTLNERRGQDMDTFTAKVIFWQRIAIRLKKLEDMDKITKYKTNQRVL